MPFDLRCHDIPRAQDTKENPCPDGVRSIGLNRQLGFLHRLYAQAVLPTLSRCMAKFHMRLAEYLQRLGARHNIRAGYRLDNLAAVYGIDLSLTTLRQWFEF